MPGAYLPSHVSKSLRAIARESAENRRHWHGTDRALPRKVAQTVSLRTIVFMRRVLSKLDSLRHTYGIESSTIYDSPRRFFISLGGEFC